MILKAKERGDASQLARYLMSLRENDHVELHDVSGFVSDDLAEAFQEAEAIARGTRCKNHLFFMSLNPPQDANVSTEAFEEAADKIERKLGLEGQPRAMVFHEKDGRRHAHVVWSRIDTDRMRAINLSHYKAKLRDVSRELYLENDWDMPRGLQDRALRDPLGFTRQEWQHAQRIGVDPREIKAALQDCWKLSDNRKSFEHALKERGFWLAKGDRRGFVAIDYRGEVYSLSRYAGVKTKELEVRLGKRDSLPSVDAIKAEIARRMSPKLAEHIKDAERDAKQRLAKLAFAKTELVARHQRERETLWKIIDKRWMAETRERVERLPSGLSGIWSRLTGRYAKVRAQNEKETVQCWQRDRKEKDALIFRQLDERQALQRNIERQQELAQEDVAQLRRDVANFEEIERAQAERKRQREEHERQKRKNARSQRKLDR